ncbi:MAG: hypothetical protein WKF96_17445 [Solirubrobacteraceae bacterium]
MRSLLSIFKRPVTAFPSGVRDRGAVVAVTHNGRAAVTEGGKGHGKTDPARGTLA